MEEKEISDFKEHIEDISDSIKLIIWKVFPEINNLDKEDIEQEVKIKVWKLISSGKKLSHFPSYIRRVVYTTTMDLMKKRGRRMTKMNFEQKSISQLKAPVNDSPDLILEKKEIRLIIGEAINSLSENRRIVLKLYLTGMNMNEMASFLNWSPKKVEHLLYRGLNDLKKKFEKEGLYYETIR